MEQPSTPIRTARDAEIAACEWLRFFGFTDSVVTPPGADGGVDVTGDRLVAQVKAQTVPVGRPVVQQLFGIASFEGKSGAVFSLAGFTHDAVDWADRSDIALFSFDLSGEPQPENPAAVKIASLRRDDRLFRDWVQLGQSLPAHFDTVKAVVPDGWIGQSAWTVADLWYHQDTEQFVKWTVDLERHQVWPDRMKQIVPEVAFVHWDDFISDDEWPLGLELDGRAAATAEAFGLGSGTGGMQKRFRSEFDSAVGAFEALGAIYSRLGICVDDFELEYEDRLPFDERMAQMSRESDDDMYRLESWEQVVEVTPAEMIGIVKRRKRELLSTGIKGLWPRETFRQPDPHPRRARWTAFGAARPGWTMEFIRNSRTGMWVQYLSVSFPSEVVPAAVLPPSPQRLLGPSWDHETIGQDLVDIHRAEIAEWRQSGLISEEKGTELDSLRATEYWRLKSTVPSIVKGLTLALDLLDLELSDFRVVLGEYD